MPEWADGLYHNRRLFSEVLVYRDDESIYIEHRGRESAAVRSTFEMVQGLKMIEDKAEDRVEEQADSIKQEAQLLRDTSG
jgi:hypothetical protein